MDKAEFKKKILGIINNRSQHFHALRDDSWQWRRISDLLDEYAQQVSRDKLNEVWFTIDDLFQTFNKKLTNKTNSNDT